MRTNVLVFRKKSQTCGKQNITRNNVGIVEMFKHNFKNSKDKAVNRTT